MAEELDRAVLAAFAVPGSYIGKPPGDPDDCTCRQCLIALGNDPATIKYVENGVLPVSALKLPRRREIG